MNSKSKAFSIRARANSFVFAWAGIRKFFLEEHNARVHLCATALVIIGSCVFSLATFEIIALLFVTAGVWISEIINTAIERTIDIISPQKDPRAGYVKDLASGATLVASCVAVVVGVIIFLPKILSL